jgi:hypothetical protein
VNAIKEVRKYLEKNAGSPSAEVLSRLTAAIAEESQFPLGELYELDGEAFELGIELAGLASRPLLRSPDQAVRCRFE